MNTSKPKLPPLVDRVEFVLLSTLDMDGYPDTRAMLNLRNERLYPHLKPLYGEDPHPLAIYLTTNAASEKMTQISACNRSSLYFFDGTTYEGVYLRGHLEIVTDKAFKRRAWGPGWEEYYPEGPESDDFTMLRFVPLVSKSYANYKTAKEKF